MIKKIFIILAMLLAFGCVKQKEEIPNYDASMGSMASSAVATSSVKTETFKSPKLICENCGNGFTGNFPVGRRIEETLRETGWKCPTCGIDFSEGSWHRATQGE